MPDHLSRTGAERLRRRERLRSSKDFRRVNGTGRRSSGRHFVIVSAEGREPGLTRLGLAVSRRVGNAVQRNRVKRRVRSWFRRERGNVPKGVDLVVIARRGAADRSGSEVAAELRGLVE